MKLGAVLMASGAGRRFGGNKLFYPVDGVPMIQRAFANLPAELFDRARKTVERVQNRYTVFHSASEAARVTMEIALHDIERMLPENQPAPRRDKGEPPPRMETDFRA